MASISGLARPRVRQLARQLAQAVPVLVHAITNPGMTRNQIPDDKRRGPAQRDEREDDFLAAITRGDRDGIEPFFEAGHHKIRAGNDPRDHLSVRQAGQADLHVFMVEGLRDAHAGRWRAAGTDGKRSLV